ncbi:MAG: hypothetical protein K0U29_00960 [Gammaproteobacteria bacterium]|nr:hypothetical protein [Gammaproteobacteria bacterium]MCH9743476.1 hypothetical protein [Gammaproteobacteria bacterium]
MLTREQAIKNIFDKHGEDTVYITSTGYISRAVYNQYKHLSKNIFFMQGSMGLAPAIGLGVALNTDKNIVVISGDGAFLMHLGITHTIRDCLCENFYHYILDNGCHESVGGYPCAKLETSYPGVTDIIKISNDGKTSRVEISCDENANSIKELLCESVSLL